MSFSPVRLAFNLLALHRKRKLFLTYQRLSGTIGKENPYVVLFLHWQPEATSLPLGYRYAQQWLLVRAITEALPEGWRLYVKEHPFIFVWPMLESFRNADFYRAIDALPRVSLLPLTSDPFALIDSCAAVATLTGTVGIQALSRGKPVLSFGAASYRNCPGVYPVQGVEEVRRALQKIQQGAAAPTESQLHHYFAWVESHSMAGVSEKNHLDPYDYEAMRDAKRSVWESLVSVPSNPPVTEYRMDSDRISPTITHKVSLIK
jgi:hypothetical protein